jgi:hypothetical protein
VRHFNSATDQFSPPPAAVGGTENIHHFTTGIQALVMTIARVVLGLTGFPGWAKLYLSPNCPLLNDIVPDRTRIPSAAIHFLIWLAAGVVPLGSFHST